MLVFGPTGEAFEVMVAQRASRSESKPAAERQRIEFHTRTRAELFLRDFGSDAVSLSSWRLVLAEAVPHVALQSTSSRDVFGMLSRLLAEGVVWVFRMRPPLRAELSAEDDETEQLESNVRDLHWIEIVAVDENDAPVPGLHYLITASDGTKRSGRLDAQGMVRVDGLPAGDCKVTFSKLDEEVWTPA